MIRQLTPSVFVVDSNEENRSRLRRVLTAMQFDVRDFASAETFLARTESAVRGCVVAGLRLGGMSGMELQTHLRQQGNLLPMILFAERVSTQLIVRTMRDGAVAFLDLPINEDELWLAVREGLAENADRVEREEQRANLRSRFGQLTEGELMVLTKVCEGLTNKEIASHLEVSVRTVEARRRRLLRKTCTNSFPELLLTYERFKTSCEPFDGRRSLATGTSG